MTKDFDELNDENLELQEQLVDLLNDIDQATCPPVSYADRRRVDAEKLRRDLHTTMHDLTNLRNHVMSESLTNDEKAINDLRNHIKLQQKALDQLQKETSFYQTQLDEPSDDEICRDEITHKLQVEIHKLKKEKRDLTLALTEVDSLLREKRLTCSKLEHTINASRPMTRGSDTKGYVKRDVTTAETAASWGSTGVRRRRAMVLAPN